MLAGISQKEAAELEDPVKTSPSNRGLGLLWSQGCWLLQQLHELCFPLPPPLLSVLSPCFFISRDRRYLKDNFPVVS